MSILKKLAGETAIYGGSTILNRLLNFVIVTPYLTRVFDNERQVEYGIHGLMYGFSALLLVVLTYGMETAFFRFASREADKNRVFSTASLSLLVSTIVFIIVLVLLAEPVAARLTRPSDAGYVVYFAFIIGFDVLSAVPFARLRLENRPYRFAVLKALNIVINGVLLIFFLEALPHLGGAGAKWAAPGRELSLVFLANLIASAVTLLLFLPDYLRARPVFDVALLRRMLAYALPLVIVGVAGMINQIGDRFMLQYLLPGATEENLRQVGLYTGCTRIAVLMSLFTQAFRYAFEPFFFRYAGQTDDREVYARVGLAFTITGSLACLGILLYLDFIRYMIDPSYWPGLDVVPVLLLAYLFLGLYYNLSVWYKLTDRTQLGSLVSVAGVAVTIGVNLWLIPRTGIMGAAWATLACFTFMLTCSYLLGQKYFRVPYPVGRIALHLLAATGAYLLSRQLGQYFGLGEHLLWSFLVNTGILFAFASLVLALEWPAIRRLLPRRTA